MLPDWELAGMQETAALLFNETAKIQRRVEGTDYAGVPIEDSWQDVATGVACRVIDSRSRMTKAWREVAQTDAMEDMVRIAFPVGTDCEQNCRVIVGSRVYHVVSVVDDRTQAVDHQVNVERYRGNDDVS